MPPKAPLPFKSVQKRDGRIVKFDQSRITNAIYRAMEATGEGDLSKDPIRVSVRALRILVRKFPHDHTPHIEEIQDVVEESLIVMDLPKTAKAYILYRSKRAEIREKMKVIPERVERLASESKKYFCSKSCQTKWRNTEFIGPKHANWKHGIYVYRSILSRNKVPKICRLCRLKDYRLLAVHHIDHNRKNNKFENLAWLCHNCHFLVHHDNVDRQRFLNIVKRE